MNLYLRDLSFIQVETVPGRYQEYYKNIAQSLSDASGPRDIHDIQLKLKVKAAQAARVIEILELALESSQKNQQRMTVFK